MLVGWAGLCTCGGTERTRVSTFGTGEGEGTAALEKALGSRFHEALKGKRKHLEANIECGWQPG